MSMTNAEANAVNQLLDWLLEHVKPQREKVTFDEAKAAAVLLADHAYKQLYAGIDGRYVAQLWDTRNKTGALRKRRPSARKNETSERNKQLATSN